MEITRLHGDGVTCNPIQVTLAKKGRSAVGRNTAVRSYMYATHTFVNMTSRHATKKDVHPGANFMPLGFFRATVDWAMGTHVDLASGINRAKSVR